MSADARSVVLAEYHHPELVYEVGGDCTVRRRDSTTATSGFVDWLQVGLVRRKRVLVALYAHDDRLLFRLESTKVDVLSEGVSIRVRKTVPFVRKMVVSTFGRVVSSVDYWARLAELSEWPVYGDFPDYVVAETSSIEARVRLVKGWMLTGAGVDLSSDEGQAQLQRSITSARESWDFEHGR